MQATWNDINEEIVTNYPKCACGIPNKANVHYNVIIGRGDSSTGTETDYVDIYVCNEHDVSDYDVHSLFEFDNANDWYVLESTRTELR